MNDLFTDDKSLLNTISERLYKLLAISYSPVNVNKIRIDIPPFVRIVFGSYNYEKNLESESSVEFEGYVAMVGYIQKSELSQQQKIFVVPPPEKAIMDSRILLFLMTLKGDLVGKVRRGDKVYGHYVCRKANFYERKFYNFEVVDLATALGHGLDDVKEFDINKIISIFANKVPPDFIDRIIDFAENFRDKQGRFKYRELADKLISKGYGDIFVENDDIKEYDNTLFLISMLNPTDFEVGLQAGLSIFVTARMLLKRGFCSGGVKLVQENDGREVVLVTEKLSRRQVGVKLDILAERLGGHIEERVVDGVKQRVLSLSFVQWAKLIPEILESKERLK